VETGAEKVIDIKQKVSPDQSRRSVSEFELGLMIINYSRK
jgi:hypothetical protein